jgi:ribonuclease HI
MEQNEVCKQCGRKLVVKATKKSASQLKKPFYYTAYYYCNYCQKLYHDEKFKVVNGQTDLFAERKPTPTLPSQGGSTPDSPPDKGELEGVLEARGIHGTRDTRGTSDSADIWTDGACTNNGYPNAKAAWAFVSGETEQAGLVPGKQTNNRAEGLAIYYALKWAAEEGFKKIRLHTDSQISLFNLAKPARLVKMNREIFEAIEKIINGNDLEVTYVKVLGHSGDPNNERADRLANGLATK